MSQELAIKFPCGVNDIMASRKSALIQKINNVPIGKYVIGYNAYVCSEHLLTPFSGLEKDEVRNDSYNFYVSQLCIQIEMAFGMMVNKW